MGEFRAFPSRLSGRRRAVYRGVVVFFLAAFALSIWPLAPIWSRARPLVFGMPFSLAFLAALLVTCFGVLWAVYRWERRNGWLDEETDPVDGD